MVLSEGRPADIVIPVHCEEGPLAGVDEANAEGGSFL